MGQTIKCPKCNQHGFHDDSFECVGCGYEPLEYEVLLREQLKKAEQDIDGYHNRAVAAEQEVARLRGERDATQSELDKAAVSVFTLLSERDKAVEERDEAREYIDSTAHKIHERLLRRLAALEGLLRERITLDHEMMDREAEREDRCYPDLDMRAAKWRHRTNVYLAGSAQEGEQVGPVRPHNLMTGQETSEGVTTGKVDLAQSAEPGVNHED